jgi:hypothetical protein
MTGPGEGDTSRSAARLGGISTMVTEADICPLCGGQHDGRRRRFWERAEPVCPVIVNGPFPVLMNVPRPAELLAEFLTPEPEPTTRVPVPAPEELKPRRASPFSISWPSLAIDEGYP